MKGLARSKSRLQSVLDAERRAQMAKAMFENVVGAARRADVMDVVVATDDPGIAQLAEGHGARVLGDRHPGEESLASVIDAALEHARDALFADAVIVLMADLPHITADDVTRLRDALDHDDLVLVADRRGRSTNALGVRVRSAFATAFGREGSFDEPKLRGQARGLRLSVLEAPRIAYDVDLPADLQELDLADAPE